MESDEPKPRFPAEELSRIVRYSLDDVGTREQHLNELLDIWSGALGIALAGVPTEKQKGLIKNLTFATELIKQHMTGIATSYNECEMRRIIDALPKNALEIQDTCDQSPS